MCSIVLSQPHVLRVGRRVRVCPADRLQECLDNASHWVDSDAVYRDILSLAGTTTQPKADRVSGVQRKGLSQISPLPASTVTSLKANLRS